MGKLGVKKEEMKEFVNELEFRVSIDFEVEGEGVVFGEIEEVI